MLFRSCSYCSFHLDCCSPRLSHNLLSQFIRGCSHMSLQEAFPTLPSCISNPHPHLLSPTLTLSCLPFISFHLSVVLNSTTGVRVCCFDAALLSNINPYLLVYMFPRQQAMCRVCASKASKRKYLAVWLCLFVCTVCRCVGVCSSLTLVCVCVPL